MADAQGSVAGVAPVGAVIPPTHDAAPPQGAERAPAPSRDDVQPVENETRDRIITGTVTVVPFLALGIAVWQTWNGLLQPRDVVIFAVLYLLTGFGVTVGLHRLFTHRAFKAKPPVRATLGVLGSMAIEGPIISWVADHRKHHAFSDRPGDPHSPHVDHGVGLRGALRGLVHAHMGWLFIHTQRGARTRYAPDLIKDPVVSFVDRTFLPWVILSFFFPFGLGVLIGGSVAAGLTAMLWGGLVRIFVLHHMTYSINSWCHFAGRKRFATKDESRNVFWLALPTFGESWHNNHHAFPTSAFHGMRRWELDPSAAVIWTLEKLGLAWDVVRVSRERQERKVVGAESAS
jgi:stearoyl-CoA desaturase (Delta-9 desaturase)